MFARNSDTSNPDSAVSKKYCDRLSAINGKLLFYPNESLDTSEEIIPGLEVFHSGEDSVVPVKNGGTGAVDAVTARKNLGITSEYVNSVIDGNKHTHKYAASNTIGGAAIKAVNDDAGNKISAYYQPKILTGTADPNKSSDSTVKKAPDGSIYIRYSK